MSGGLCEFCNQCNQTNGQKEVQETHTGVLTCLLGDLLLVNVFCPFFVPRCLPSSQFSCEGTSLKSSHCQCLLCPTPQAAQTCSLTHSSRQAFHFSWPVSSHHLVEGDMINIPLPLQHVKLSQSQTDPT